MTIINQVQATDLLPDSRTVLDEFNSFKRKPTVDFAMNMRSKHTGSELVGWVDIDFTASTFNNNAYLSDTWRTISRYGDTDFISVDGTLQAGSYVFAIKCSAYEMENTDSFMKKCIFNIGIGQGTNDPFQATNIYENYYNSSYVRTNPSDFIFIRRTFSSDTRLRLSSSGAENIRLGYMSIHPLITPPHRDFMNLSYTNKGRVKGRQSFYWCKTYPCSQGGSSDSTIKDAAYLSFTDDQVGNEIHINSLFTPSLDRDERDILGNVPTTDTTFQAMKDQDAGHWWGVSSNYFINNNEAASYPHSVRLSPITVRGSEEKPNNFNFPFRLIGNNTITEGNTSGYYIRGKDYNDVSSLNPLSTHDLTEETYSPQYRNDVAPLVQGSFYFKTRRRINTTELFLDFLDLWKSELDSTHYDTNKTRWSMDLFKGNQPRVAILTVRTPTSPQTLERVHFEGGYDVVGKDKVTQKVFVGIGGHTSAIMVFKYPEVNNAITQPPCLKIVCNDGILPEMEIEMHVLDWYFN